MIYHIYRLETIHGSRQHPPWWIHIIALKHQMPRLRRERDRGSRETEQFKWRWAQNCHIHTILSSIRLWLSTSSFISPDNWKQHALRYAWSSQAGNPRNLWHQWMHVIRHCSAHWRFNSRKLWSFNPSRRVLINNWSNRMEKACFNKSFTSIPHLFRRTFSMISIWSGLLLR